jgi:signal transduction histidine kinase
MPRSVPPLRPARVNRSFDANSRADREDARVDEWRRGFAGWHAVFGVLAVLTVVVVFPDVKSLVLLAVLSVWYAVVGAPALRAEPGRRGLLYAVVAAPLTVTLFAFDPSSSIMLFALYPHMWALLPVRGAIVGTVVVITAVAVVTVLSESLLFAVVFGGVTLLVGLLLGLWITRIIDQSRHRAALVVTERQRLAREIHDTLAQGFAAVLLQLEAIESTIGPNEHVAKARRVARENLAEARALVDALAPPHLHASSLPDALRRIADARGACFQLTGRPRALPATQEVMLLRAVQEALTNADKHAAAGRTEVALHYADAVTLVVSDDGAGFDTAQQSTGFGLTAMRSRAAEAGAELTIHSVAGDGTELRLEIHHDRASTDRR